MDDQSPVSLADRLAACESELARLHTQLRRQRRVVAAGGAGLALLGALAATGFSRAAGDRTGALDADSLRVRALVVVDAGGTVRARVGGDLPDAVDPDGTRHRRGDRAAGVLLYDATGQERGGYVTFDRSGVVGLTLDNQRPSQQAASFFAYPGGGATLELHHGGAVQARGRPAGTPAEDEYVELRADTIEGARLTAVRGGAAVAQTPAPTPAQTRATCAEMRRELLQEAQLRADAAQKVCSARLPATACRACFGATSSGPPSRAARQGTAP